MRKTFSLVITLLVFLLVSAFAQTKGDTKAGKVKYDQLCAGCHGATGKGDGAAAAALNPKPGGFTSCTAMAKNSDKDLFKIIKEGGPSVKRSPLMPPWGGSLSDAEVQNLVAYVRSFCKK